MGDPRSLPPLVEGPRDPGPKSRGEVLEGRGEGEEKGGRRGGEAWSAKRVFSTGKNPIVKSCSWNRMCPLIVLFFCVSV